MNQYCIIMSEYVCKFCHCSAGVIDVFNDEYVLAGDFLATSFLSNFVNTFDIACRASVHVAGELLEDGNDLKSSLL